MERNCLISRKCVNISELVIRNAERYKRKKRNRYTNGNSGIANKEKLDKWIDNQTK